MRKKFAENSYELQHKIKRQNQNRIINLLAETGGLAFGELLKRTGLSPIGLTRHLKELEKEKRIQLTIKDRKRVYQLGEKPQLEKALAQRLEEILGRLFVIQLLENYIKGEHIIKTNVKQTLEDFLKLFNIPLTTSLAQKILDELVI